MSRREKLLDLLVARTSASRERLEYESTEELEKILDKSLLAGIHAEVMNSPEIIERQNKIDEINEESHRQYEEFQFSVIFHTAISGNVAIDNQSNRGFILGWLQEDQGESISATWFQKVLKENPALAHQLSWQSADLLDPRKQKEAAEAQAEQDRETFNQFARENGLSECESNHLLVKSVLGHGFDRYKLAQAVQSNALQLAPAPPEELEQFRQDAAEERRDFLINQASPQELRQAARSEAEQRRIQFQRAEAERQIAFREQKDAAVGYPPLPEVNGEGQKIDAAYLNKISNTNLQLFKNLMRRHGASNLTARLRGIR